MNAVAMPPRSPRFRAEAMRIGGERVSTERVIEVLNPWSGEVVGTVPRATPELVAEAFQSVGYPILPSIERRDRQDPLCPGCVDEILHVRHHSLFVPRDFDVSPYFQVVKPTLEAGFDPRPVIWAPVRGQGALP